MPRKLTALEESVVAFASEQGQLAELCVLVDYDPDVGRVPEHWVPRPDVMGLVKHLFAGPPAAAEASRAQSNSNDGVSDEDLCALEHAVTTLRAIADRQQQVGDVLEPVNDIRTASARAKHALRRLAPVVNKLGGPRKLTEQ